MNDQKVLSKTQRRKRDFSFTEKEIQFLEKGTAEFEKNEISSIYLDNDFLNEAMDFSNLKTFFVARTGVGKSAIIERIKLSCNPKYVIQIDPESFMPSLLRNATDLETLERNGINIDYFLKTLWRFVIVVELLKGKFGSNKKGLIDYFKLSDGKEKAAYSFLSKYEVLGPNYSAGERVLGFVTSLLRKVEISLQSSGFSVKASIGESYSEAEKTIIRSVLKEFEYPEVGDLVRSLDKFLEGESYYILIDDLDKTWIESTLGISLIKSLFLAMTDIATLNTVKPVVSLRSNLFTQIKFSQPEKLKTFIRKVAWSDNDLRNMVNIRFKYFYGVDLNYVWQHIFPTEIHFDSGTKISVHHYLMGMSNRRPRDLFYLLAYAMKLSKGKNRLTQDAFKKSEHEFSEDRLENFIAEWESPFNSLGELLTYFRGCKNKMSGKELRSIIDSMVVHISDSEHQRTGKFSWAKNNKIVDGSFEQFGDPQGMFEFLYRIGVIGYKDAAHKLHYSFDFDQAPFSHKLTDETPIFLNPALAWALTKMPSSTFSLDEYLAQN